MDIPLDGIVEVEASRLRPTLPQSVRGVPGTRWCERWTNWALYHILLAPRRSGRVGSESRGSDPLRERVRAPPVQLGA
jgi:hypothetical protein